MIKRTVEPLVAAVIAGFVVVALASRWSDVAPHVDELSLLAVGLSFVSVLVGLLASMQAWRRLLADFGSQLPLRASVWVFFVGHLGKYVPGSVWAVAVQTRLGERFGVPKARTVAVGAVNMAVGVLSGILVALLTLPFVAPDEVRRFGWLVALVPLLLLLLRPRTLTWALAKVRRPLEHEPSWRGVTGALGWMAVMWGCFGVHVWLLARDLGGTGAALLPLALGAFAAAWTAGFLVVVAPAGAGVRDAGLLLFLAGPLGRSPATLLAVGSRLLLTVADLGWAGVVLLLRRL